MQTKTNGRSLPNSRLELAGRLALGLGMALVLGANAQNDFRPDRILIQPKAGVSSGQLDAFHGALGTQVLRNFPAYENMQVLGLPAELDVSTALQSYLESGLVDVAEPATPPRTGGRRSNDSTGMSDRGTSWGGVSGRRRSGSSRRSGDVTNSR